MNSVNIKNYADIPVNKKEILRYYNGGKECVDRIDDALLECNNAFSYSVTYLLMPIKIENGTIDFEYFSVESSNLAKNLNGCKFAVVFVATVGVGIDRLIKKYSVLSPSKSLLFQAIGAERIESLCNVFCQELKHEYGKTKPRFSAGFGDLKLETQEKIFKLLTPSNIGVSLGKGLIMSPSKSVTAFVGIE